MRSVTEAAVLFGLAGLVVGVVAMGRWWRRRLLLVAAGVALAAVELGEFVAVLAVGTVALGLGVWRLVSPATFARVVMRYIRFGRRRTWYRQHWQALMVGHRLVRERGRGEERVTVLPRLGRVRCGDWLDRLWVRPVVGQSVEDWARVTEALAMAMGARECRVAVERPGLLRLEVLWGDPLATVVPALAVPAAVDLAAVPVGVREDGGPWTVRLTGNHLLVAGVTGAGKSSVVWSIVRGIAPAVHKGVVQLWAVDPKGGMELAPGRALFARFGGAEVEAMVELLEEAVAVMRARATRYAGHVRSTRRPWRTPWWWCWWTRWPSSPRTWVTTSSGTGSTRPSPCC
jgi:S-DNA-T family DNA segregation ATPase FtsK/SpoIIIE